MSEESLVDQCCVVVPALHEEGRIGGVVRGVLERCPHILVVDDGSTDGTAAEAEAAGAVVLKQQVNQGKGIALQDGLEWARQHGFAIAITLDGDGQHAPEDLLAFLAEYDRTGTPVLLGNRMADQQDMPLIRRWTNRFMSFLLSRLTGIDLPDTQCGYRLYRCDVLPEKWPVSEGFAAESEILLDLAQRRVPMGSVPITTIYGNEQSKIRPIPDTIRFIRMLIRFRRATRGR